MAAPACASPATSLAPAGAAAPSAAPGEWVVGNEAGDADSCVAAWVVAQLRGAQAVFNFARAELALRPDVAAILTEGGVDLARVLFADELAAQPGAAAARPLVLVDHNRVAPHQQRLFGGGAVVGVVDHHADAREHLDAAWRVVRPVESCCTLVAEWARGRRDATAAHARVLADAILLDTANTWLREGKRAPADAAALAWLLAECGAVAPDAYAAERTRALRRPRFDTACLSTRGLLAKDLKRAAVDGVGLVLVPAAPCSLDAWLARDPHLVRDLAAWCAEHKAAAAVAMTLHAHEAVATPTSAATAQVRRELLVWSGDARARDLLCARLQAADLALEPYVGVEGGTGALAFHQRNVAASRKQVLPALATPTAPPASAAAQV